MNSKKKENRIWKQKGKAQAAKRGRVRERECVKKKKGTFSVKTFKKSANGDDVALLTKTPYIKEGRTTLYFTNMIVFISHIKILQESRNTPQTHISHEPSSSLTYIDPTHHHSLSPNQSHCIALLGVFPPAQGNPSWLAHVWFPSRG